MPPGTQHPKQRQPRRPTSRAGKVALYGLLGCFAVAVLAIVVLIIMVSQTKVPLPQDLSQAQTTLVTYADGSPLGAIQAENRTIIPVSQVPPQVKVAVLAAEDKNYYSEPGVSVLGIVRAGFTDLIHHRLEEGGSTITEQYVKNAIVGNDRTFSRKLNEAIIAFKLNQRYSKDEILGFYLNTIYFGRGAYGIEAASETYFGVTTSKLTTAQGAVLAGSIRSPEFLDPSSNPTDALIRWHQVLSAMVRDGFLPSDQAATMTFPTVRPRSGGAPGGQGNLPAGNLSDESGYLLDLVRSELQARHFTTQQIYQGGLRVKSTIDPKAEMAAINAVDSVLKSSDDPQAALVAVAPGTGRVLALYGGRAYATRQFDNATQALRQPGSSFKPYVLGAALSQGISLQTTFNGASPQSFPGYSTPVENFDNEQFGTINLIDATANSVNTVYVPLAQRAGLSKVVDTARAAGIPNNDPGNGLQSAVTLQPDPSLALGTFEVHPIDQAAAFATFAAQGKAATPFLVDTVSNANGQQLYHSSVHAEQTIDKNVVADLTFALEHVVTAGTASPEAELAGGRPAAGKTGTTSDSKDAWFCGYTPSLAAAVWMGYDPKNPGDRSTLTAVEGVPTVTGGTLPARIWKRFMDATLAGTPIQQFPPPANVGQAPTTTSSSSTSTTSSSTTTTTTPTISTVAPFTIPEDTTSTFPEVPTTRAHITTTTRVGRTATTTVVPANSPPALK